jgi:hypothetical protein
VEAFENTAKMEENIKKSFHWYKKLAVTFKLKYDYYTNKVYSKDST